MFDDVLDNLFDACLQKGLKISTAESCTGGLVAHVITSRAGSSALFDRGFVTYSNEAKMDMLGVSSDTLNDYGAVSAQTATQMADGAIKHSLADMAVSITGIAGPDGGSVDKPVGLVHFAVSGKGSTRAAQKIFTGDRHDVQKQAALYALNLLLDQALSCP